MSDIHKPLQTCPKQYPWAVNNIKLNLAYTHLKWEKDNDPTIEIDEKTIKEKYIALKGLLSTERDANLKKFRPRSTSNVDHN